MKRLILPLLVLSLCVLSCTSKKAEPILKVRSITCYDASSSDGYDVRTFNYDEEGRLIEVVTSAYEGNGDLCSTSSCMVKYYADSSVVDNAYSLDTFFYEEGIITRLCTRGVEYEGAYEELYNYKDGHLETSDTQGGEVEAYVEYEWENGNLVTRTGYAEGCSAKHVFTYSDVRSNFSVDLLSFFDQAEIYVSNLPGSEQMNSAMLPESEMEYNSYYDGDGNEYSGLDMTINYSYQKDDSGRLVKIVKTTIGESWTNVRTMEISYVDDQE